MSEREKDLAFLKPAQGGDSHLCDASHLCDVKVESMQARRSKSPAT